MEDAIEEASDSNSESDDGDGTLVTVEMDEITSASVDSAHSGPNSNSASLDAALRLASQRAGAQAQATRRTQPLEDGEEAIPALMGWGKKSSPESDALDMDMTHAMGGIIQSTQSPREPSRDDDMSMEVTQAFGGILSQSKPQSPRRPEVEDSSTGEIAMDLTSAIGGIRPPADAEGDSVDNGRDEDMSMELTTVMGGVLASISQKNPDRKTRRRTIRDLDEDQAPMNMTTSVGKILSSQQGAANNEDDATMDMEVTTALGGILKPASPSRTRSAARKVMEQEADQPGSANATASPKIRSPPKRGTAASPSAHSQKPETPGRAAFRGKGLRRSPQAKAAGMRTPPQQTKTSKLFQKDPATGITTPRVVLTPKPRRLSGIGADKSGLGSPKVAKIFGRRESIGDSAVDFAPDKSRHQRTVAFDDPRVIEREVDKERQDDEAKENGRKILEREADGSQDERDETLISEK